KPDVKRVRTDVVVEQVVLDQLRQSRAGDWIVLAELENLVHHRRDLRHEIVDEILARPVEADFEHEVRLQRVVVHHRKAAAVEIVERAEWACRLERSQQLLERTFAAFDDRGDDREYSLLHVVAKRTTRLSGVIRSSSL